MAIGTVKRLVRNRGFGFLEDNQGHEYFFHRSGVQGTSFDNLDEGQQVEFTVEREEGGRGPRANDVRPMSGEV